MGRRDSPFQNQPVLARHRLRLELRRAREVTGLTQRHAAKELRWSDSKVFRIEAGHTGISHTDLKALLELYGTCEPERFARLAELAEQSRRQPWTAYRDVLRHEELVYLGYESVAVRLRAFQRLGVHELLQTEDYARCIIRALGPDRPAGDVDRLVEVRMRRQDHLLQHHTDSAELSIILDESATLEPPGVGEHAVLRDQLERLHELAELPHVTIRVVPIAYGHHPGVENPFAIVDLPADAGSVVYWEGWRGSSIIRESADEVTCHGRLFDRLAAHAPPASGGPRS